MTTQMSHMGMSARNRKSGLTLDELRAFVVQANTAGVPGDSPVHAVVGFRSQVQALEARPDKRRGVSVQGQTR